MLIDLLSSSSIAADLLERTASTPGVLRAVESSLTPAFLLVGIGGVMNVMMARLNWIAGRIERLEERDEADASADMSDEIAWLCARRHHARRAMMFSAAAAVVVSIVIALLFVSTYIQAKIGTIIAVLWVLTMIILVTGLVCFLRETRLAAQGHLRKERK